MATAFQQLSISEAYGLGEGVEVVFLTTNLLRDDTATSYLVTRPEQRKVVEYAFTVSRNSLNIARHTVALRGSPGIGKS